MWKLRMRNKKEDEHIARPRIMIKIIVSFYFLPRASSAGA